MTKRLKSEVSLPPVYWWEIWGNLIRGNMQVTLCEPLPSNENDCFQDNEYVLI